MANHAREPSAGATWTGLLRVCVVVAWAVAASVLTSAARASARAVGAPGPATLEDLLSATAATCALLVMAWLSGGLLLTLLAATGGRLGRRCASMAGAVAPVAVRRLGAALLGAAVLAGPAAGTAAASGAPPAASTVASTVASTAASGAAAPSPPPAQAASGTGVLSGVAGTDGGTRAAGVAGVVRVDRPAVADADTTTWVPDRPATPVRPQSRPEGVRLVTATPHPEHSPGREVVVLRGDSLWDITARYLGPRASAAEVAVEWPRWYAANREVIGAEPALIRPGQVLVPPTPRR